MAARKSAKKKLPSMTLLKKATSVGDVVRFFLHIGKTADEVRGIVEERAAVARPIPALKGFTPEGLKHQVNHALTSLESVTGPVALPDVFKETKAKKGARTKAAPKAKAANKRNAKKAAPRAAAKAPKATGSKAAQARELREANASKRGSKRR